MARKVSQSDPALAIEFWLSGFYTHRSQLFAPFKGIGVNVVSFHDPVIDGANMEDTDLYEWSRRPGFSIFCPTPLVDGEIINQFYDMRNLNGDVISFFDSTIQLASFNQSGYTQIIPKTTTEQGFITAVGSMVYFSDGASVDMQKWLSTKPFTTINPSTWGIPAPTLTPTIFNRGCWLPRTNFVKNNAILDPNGSVEVVTTTFGGSGISGDNEPLWPTTKSSTVSDGSIQWTNDGPLETWLPATFFPVPVVVLDTNGNLELATATNPAVLVWNPATVYAVGITVSFAGEYWTNLVAGNTDIPPNSNYTVTTGGITQPYWVEAQNPSQTGTYPTTPFTPAWNKTVGGTTVDGNYTWTNLGPGNLVESFGTSYVYCYRTIYGHLSTASPISINTGAIFGPVVATITSFAINNNVVTFQGVNNFIPGNVFSVQELSNGIFLNNQSFTVIAAGLSPTQFSAVFDFPNTPSTTDSGSTLNLIATVTGIGNNSPLCNATVTITATQVTAGVVRVFAVNNFVPGLQVTFSGLITATFLNNLQFEIINVDPAGQWFEVFFTTSLGVVPPDQPMTADFGTATFNSIEIYRTSDGGGIYLFTGAVTNPTGTTIIPFDSGTSTAGTGTDNGIPGAFPWTNPGNVSSTTAYATAAVPTPTGGTGSRFTRVQMCQNITAISHSTPVLITAAFGSSVTAGNDIIASVAAHEVSSATLSDSNGNTYNLITTVSISSGDGPFFLSIYIARNVAAGPTTVRLSAVPTGSGFYGFNAVECNGLTGVVDVVNTNSFPNNSGGPAAFNTGTVTTTNAHDVVFSFIWALLSSNHPEATEAASAPAGWVLSSNQVVFDAGDNTVFDQMAAAYQVESAIGTFSPTWTTPQQSKMLGATVAFKLTLIEPSDGLLAQDFAFSVPPDISITGIEIDFQSFFTGTPSKGVLDVQLLRGGVPAGLVMQVSPTNTVVNYTLGGPGNLWGTTWASSDFSSPAWGVRIIATQVAGGVNATFDVRNVRARITGSTSTTGWVFNDFTTDANLNILEIAPQNHLNDPPPGAPGSSVNQVVGTLTTYWQGRLWMVVGNYVYFSAGSDCTNGVPEEAWPPANRFQFSGPVFGLSKTADGVGLLVYLADRVNAILGGPETISFYPTDALDNFGISNVNAMFRDGSIIGQFTTQKQYFDLVDGRKEQTGEHVADYLTENFSAAATYATMHRDGLDVGMFLSNGVDQVLRYGSNISAWSVPAFPLGGAGALRSIETSVGIHSLMLASPVAAHSGNTAQVFPALGQSIDAFVLPPPITQFIFGEGNDGFNLPFTNPVQDGSTIVVIVPAFPFDFHGAAVTDNMSNNYALLDTITSAGNNTAQFIFVAQNVTGGMVVVSAFSDDWISNGILAVELHTAYAVDGVAHQLYTPGPTALNSGVIAATGPYDIIIGMAYTVSPNDHITVNSDSTVLVPTQILTGGTGLVSAGYKTGGAGSQTISWTRSSSGTGEIITSGIAVHLIGGGVPWNNPSNITLQDPTQYATITLIGTGSGGLDQQATNSDYSDAISVGPVTPSVSQEWALFVSTAGLMANASQPTFTPGSGWSSFIGGGGIGAIYSQSLPSLAPVTGTATLNTTPFPASTWASSLLTFVLAAPPAAPVVVQTSGATTGPNNGTTYAFTNPVTAGNAIVFFLLGQSDSSTTGTTFTVTDALGNSYDIVADIQVGPQPDAPFGCRLGVAVAQNIAGGADTLTLHATWGGGQIGGDSFAVELNGLGTLTGPSLSQILAASAFPFNLPANVIVQGVQVSVTGMQVQAGSPVPFTIKPLNPVVGAESETGHFDNTNTTLVFGGPTDLWGMPWQLPSVVNNPNFGFGLQILDGNNVTMSVSEVQVQVFYQQPSSYIRARDLNSWGDSGQYGQNNGTPYPSCFITVGSITLSQPGAKMFPLQHVVGYFDAVGTLQNGGSSRPDIWVLPNEVSDTAGIGFVYLPEIIQEPPTGQNQPSKSLLALRWPVNMANSNTMSQMIHHLQVKIMFEPENAPNTIKALAFKEDQE